MTDAAPLATPSAYADAVATAVQAAAAYYADGSTPLGDDEYDALVRGIEAYEAAHLDEVLPDSPTGKVAGGAATGDVPHSVPMLSLDNVFSADELAAWAAGLSAASAVRSTAGAWSPSSTAWPSPPATAPAPWSRSSPVATVSRARTSPTPPTPSSACPRG